jgi:hypothetical protein
MAMDGSIDLLHGFSDACHHEFRKYAEKNNSELHPASSIFPSLIELKDTEHLGVTGHSKNQPQ